MGEGYTGQAGLLKARADTWASIPGGRLGTMDVVGYLWRARHIHWALCIFALALLLRVAWSAAVNADPIGDHLSSGYTRGHYDEAFYYWAARSLAEGEGYREPLSSELTAHYPPGYPFALAALFSLYRSDLLVARLFNAVLGGITAVLVYAIAARIGDRRSGIAAGFLIALFPSQVFFSTVVMSETLFVTLCAAWLLLLLTWVGDAGRLRAWQALLMGFLLGALSLVRAEALLLAPAVVLLWKLWGQRWVDLGRLALIVLVGMAALIGPWTARNYVRFGEFIVLRGGDHEVLEVVRYGLAPDYQDTHRKLVLGIDAPPLSEELGYYGSRPWRILTTGASKMRDLYAEDAPFEFIQGAYDPPLSPQAQSRWSYVASSYFFAVALAALLGAPFWLKRDRQRWLLVWFVLSWSAVYLIFVPVSRYHFPVIPVLCVMAAVALTGLWDGVRRLPARLIRR